MWSMNDGSAPVLYWRYYLNRPRGLKETHDHDQARARPLRAFSHRQAAHRRRSHRHLQLGLRPGYRRHLRAAHRGHRPGAFHRGEHPDHSARAEVDGPRLGRGPGGGLHLAAPISRPSAPTRTRQRCRSSSTPAPLILASAPRRSWTPSARPPRKPREVTRATTAPVAPFRPTRPPRASLPASPMSGA